VTKYNDFSSSSGTVKETTVSDGKSLDFSSDDVDNDPTFDPDLTFEKRWVSFSSKTFYPYTGVPELKG
jgi:hypothetical protein